MSLTLTKIPASPRLSLTKGTAAPVVPTHILKLRRPFIAEGVFAWDVFGAPVRGGWQVGENFYAADDVVSAASLVF